MAQEGNSGGVFRQFTLVPTPKALNLHKSALSNMTVGNPSSPPLALFLSPSTMALESTAPETLDDVSGEELPLETMQEEDADEHDHKISDYELSREERIRENRERMQRLGIFDLSQKLNALKPTPKRPYHRKIPRSDLPLPPSGPARRSSRLQNSTPVSYCEVPVAKKDKSLNHNNILREEGSRPEVYTEEHEKLLGNTEMSWTFFVDGYGKDGKRIYDPVRGKTCHQCRQKTLGHRTHCCKCNMVQGQFCGDCLYMRYGENVLEAKANPNWICPVCRGICNCSLCRQAKGWPPTGMLYKKVSSLGYKSVAHYLIQTRRAATDSDTSIGSKVPVSAKRSLPFSDIEVTVKEEDLSGTLNPDPLSISSKELGDQKMAPETGAGTVLNPAAATLMKDQVECPLKPKPENGADCDKDKEAEFLVDGEFVDQKMAPETGAGTVLNPAAATLMKDQVEFPLKPKLENGADCDKDKEAEFLVDGEVDKSSIEPETVEEQKVTREPLINESENLHKDVEGGDGYEIKKESFVLDKRDVFGTEKTPKFSRKRVCCEPTPDSIAGRLRLRRNRVV